MKVKLKGRPPKAASEKLNRSINLKLTELDLKTIRERATKVRLTATQYARMMTLKGVVKSRFSAEELDLMRKIAGVANNINQIARRLNADYERYKIEGVEIVALLRTLLYGRQKH